MKLKPNMIITVRLEYEDESEELQLLIVTTGGGGKERLSLKAPLARLLGRMGIGDTLTWKASMIDAESMRVELVKVEEATE